VGDLLEGSSVTARLRRTRIRPWPYFGGLAVVCFALQVVTGVIMALSYEPTPAEAYVSTFYIANVMRYGWLVRTVHHWGAHLTVFFAGLHCFRMFATASYKPPRRANWVVGAVGLLAAVGLAFTGNLLPWDQSALADTTAAIELFRHVPLAGDAFADLLLGGEAIGAATLTRFYAAHVAVLPAIMLGLLATHAWLGRRNARSMDRSETDRPSDYAPLYPDILVSGSTTLLLLLSVYAVLAILVPATLDVKADPSAVVESARPAWYFLSMSALVRYVPPALAATATILLGVLFVLLPYVDRTPSHEPRERIVALAVGFTVIAGALGLTVLGATL
jgi:ubiquinol-cytochrome c reductase cytochrome b subunit